MELFEILPSSPTESERSGLDGFGAIDGFGASVGKSLVDGLGGKSTGGFTKLGLGAIVGFGAMVGNSLADGFGAILGFGAMVGASVVKN